MALLRPGDKLTAFYSRQSVEILRPLKSGGQGELFVVRWNGCESVLKWYKPHYREEDPDLRERLSKLILMRAPSAYFLWPEDVVERGADFGYLMPLAPPAFQAVARLLTGNISCPFRSVISAALLLADNFRTLHTKGKCYRDISYSNILLDPAGGDIRIVDNDNVSDDHTWGLVGGTPGFMPPEVVLGKIPASSFSDLHAMAVLLFWIFVRQHPLKGSLMDHPRFIGMDEENLNRILLGEKPLFIFDPLDQSNRPDRNADALAILLWAALPAFIQRTFTQAFTAGLRDPANGRIRETQWRQELARLADLLFYCPSCKAELFFDEERFRSQRQLEPCWQCRISPRRPPLLRLKSYVVPLGQGAFIYSHRIDGPMTVPLASPAGEVSGGMLRNRSRQEWRITSSGGASRVLGPGQSCGAGEIKRIDFGKISGDVEQ